MNLMDEDVGLTVVRSDESESFDDVEPFAKTSTTRRLTTAFRIKKKHDNTMNDYS